MQTHKQLTKANKEQDPFVLYTYFVNDDVTTSTVDHGFEPRLGQIKEYKVSMYCFSAKHTALRRKSKH